MHIIISAYRCDPYDFSEAYSSFHWLEILLSKHQITLLTTESNKVNIEKYYSPKSFPSLTIIPFSDNYPGRSNRFLHQTLKLGYFFFNQKIEAFLKKNKSIVHTANLLFHRSPQSFRYFSALRKYDKPFVLGPLEGGLKPASELKNYFSKESSRFKLRNLDKWLLKQTIYQEQFEKASKIFISLDYMLDIIDEKFHNKTIQIFNTGINCNEWVPNGSTKNNEIIQVLFVGTLTRYKGCELAIRALSSAYLKNVNLVFNIVGRGEEEAFLKQLARELNVQDKVVFHGFIPRAQIKTFYDRADIFCFPTLKEAAGNVLLEAMSCAIPIITVNTGGPKYMCSDKGCIKLPIQPMSEMTESIAKALYSLATEEHLRKEMGLANRQHCLENYDWEAMKKKILAIFDNPKNFLS